MSFRGRRIFATRRELSHQYERLRESEQQLRTVFEDAPVGMLVLDGRGVIVKTNSAFCAYAQRSEDELVGMNYLELAYPEDRAAYAERFASLIAERGGEPVERRFLTSGGEEIWAFISLSPLTCGDRPELLVHVLDITEQRRVKLELEERNLQLLEEDRLKDELIAVVSHDLRTPLTSIIGYLELALEDDAGDPLSAERRSYLDVARRNSQRLFKLVEDLLFVSRTQAGRATLDLARVDLAEVVCGAVDAAMPAAAVAGVDLSYRCDSDAGLVGDAHRIEEVIENLLSNALKFTDEGGRVEVGVTARDDDVVLCVSDNGRGIAATDQAHLFKRFFRSQDSVSLPGAGLGLAIVKAIVDAHAGTVEVTSRAGAGTAFEVRLPRTGPPVGVEVAAA